MTTHDQHQEVTEFTTAPADFTDGQSRTPQPEAEPTTDREPAPSIDDARMPAAHSTESQPSDDALFADHDLSDLRSRWNEVQATFVDDPRDCVQKADGLVSDTVEQLTSSFSNARSRLEEQWSRGEEASTEELRLALKRYRDFFDRLLAV
ncbi:hypothetical protein BH09ACT8_BH09ACT8_31380 [soil metagenome]